MRISRKAMRSCRIIIGSELSPHYSLFWAQRCLRVADKRPSWPITDSSINVYLSTSHLLISPQLSLSSSLSPSFLPLARWGSRISSHDCFHVFVLIAFCMAGRVIAFFTSRAFPESPLLDSPSPVAA